MTQLRPPSLPLLLLEGRVALELAAYWVTYPWLARGVRGDGHSVLVLPGLGGSDFSTALLRSFLKRRGWRAHGWKQGRNVGPVAGLGRALAARVDDVHARSSRKITLIGWSLGGIYARELAKQFPDKVRQVITLCSPFGGDVKASNARRAYERLSKRFIRPRDDRDLRPPPPVPTTAIYSRTDGIVDWRGCLESPGPERENIEVAGSHIGMGHHPLALYVIADRLAQPEGAWRPFTRTGARRPFYPGGAA